MFDFSGKGNNGLFSGGKNQSGTVHQVKVSESIRNPDNGKDGNVHYWFDYAQALKENVKGLIDSKDEAFRIAAERRAVNAGLRAVIRDLLKVIREKDPTNPLLDKKNRDRLFAQFEKEEMDKVLKSTGAKAWSPRERPAENTSE
ncbi:MAG: hypothetical protein CTY35_00530 [Methylotenera sp.]|uniref:hypothetical protein n=1 Tax=Methylotenera sp. TaxID=2051956 RepID=UPI000D4E2B68|nr:hypothetical protein [Methylotenera sp.]PPC84841.1 MAG: hypothetical protein CTY38_00525 [Methylotenera sp.]PPD02201.1 MAG: hypothetical protein CTY35_00530 [Methylotenera sp.]